jgi:2-polyprenyl-6-methoxyphenol hydroxylase-like FAD-dependent oxidoreductase
MSRPSIAVLGAGLQGCCVSLALAARGYRVLLLERRAAPLQATALRNEGKIHLGFVYALDASGVTCKRMLEGALSFAPLIDRWCGRRASRRSAHPCQASPLAAGLARTRQRADPRGT